MKFSSLTCRATLLRGYVQLSTSVVPGQARRAEQREPRSEPWRPRRSLRRRPLRRRQPPLPGTDHRRHQGPAGADPVPQPAADRRRGDLFLPVDTSADGRRHGPRPAMQLDANRRAREHGAGRGQRARTACATRSAARRPSRSPATPRTAPPCTCTAASPPGSATARRTSGSRPAGEDTAYPQGVSVSNVPDMPDPGPGAETFFYTNQQSARLMFYHDHAWGITRLNVYAGEAAAYLAHRRDRAEPDRARRRARRPRRRHPARHPGQDLRARRGARWPRSDPTWDAARWGGDGSLWTPHVYMPAQNPGDPSGMSAFGRWMYGPWFWPPAKDAKYPPIANPYFDPACDPNVQPFCEPALIPSTPNISVGHGSLQRHAHRQRHGLSHHHGRSQGLPLPHPQRGQRPLLEPAVVRRRSLPPGPSARWP